MDIYRTTLNISLCQDGCDFQSYDIETKKAKCDCYSQTNDLSIEELSDIKFDKNQMIDDFYQTIQNSNFRVLKCYELVFNVKIFIKNIGSIGMSVLLALFLLLIIFHLTLGPKKIHFFIQIIIKNKYLENKNSSNSDNQLILKENNKKKVNKNNDFEKGIKNKSKNKKKRTKRNSVIYKQKSNLDKIRDIKRKKTSVNRDNKGVPPRRKNTNYKKVKNEQYLSSKKHNKYDYSLISSKIMTLNLNDNSNDSEITNKHKRKSKHKKNTKKYENDLIVYHKHKDSKDEKTRLNQKRSTAIGTPKRLKSKKLTKKMKNILSFSKKSEAQLN
jgi:hypothetical protein